VNVFFDQLRPHRTALLTHMSAAAPAGSTPVVAKRASRAEICLDSFHVVKRAGDRVDGSS
jgi:hypothetical protein